MWKWQKNTIIREKLVELHLITDTKNPGIAFTNSKIDGTVKWPQFLGLKPLLSNLTFQIT